MIANFSQELYKKLIQNGFSTIRGIYQDTVIDNNTKFIILIKEEGASWFVVVLVNMDLLSISEFNKFNLEHIVIFNKFKQKYNAKNIVVTNIMITKNPTEIINSYINNLEDFIEEPINIIYWNINISDGNVIVNEKHPTEVLNLRKIMTEAYNDVKPRITQYNYGKDINDLKILAFNEDPYKQKNNIPYFTYAIILVNLLIFIVMELNGGSSNIQNLIIFGAIEPNLILFEKEYYRLFTAMFIHIGFSHLAFNTFSIYIFGSRAEKYYGHYNFITIYILGGLVGSLFSVLFTRSISAGASGAIFSIVGAIAVIAKLRGRNLEGLNYYTMLMYIIFSLGVNLMMTGIDNFGHLGGLIGGCVLGYSICKLYEKGR